MLTNNIKVRKSKNYKLITSNNNILAKIYNGKMYTADNTSLYPIKLHTDPYSNLDYINHDTGIEVNEDKLKAYKDYNLIHWMDEVGYTSNNFAKFNVNGIILQFSEYNEDISVSLDSFNNEIIFNIFLTTNNDSLIDISSLEYIIKNIKTLNFSNEVSSLNISDIIDAKIINVPQNDESTKDQFTTSVEFSISFKIQETLKNSLIYKSAGDSIYCWSNLAPLFDFITNSPITDLSPDFNIIIDNYNSVEDSDDYYDDYSYDDNEFEDEEDDYIDD